MQKRVLMSSAACDNPVMSVISASGGCDTLSLATDEPLDARAAAVRPEPHSRSGVKAGTDCGNCPEDRHASGIAALRAALVFNSPIDYVDPPRVDPGTRHCRVQHMAGKRWRLGRVGRTR